MKKAEQGLTREEQKAKIRERYKGIDTDALEVIPAKKKADFYDDEKRRVGVYVRVSTDNLQQTSSYELQKNYYEDKVRNNENWELIKIYADEGISGTSLKNRDAFNEMIADSKAGKLDLIITKSVSRFARNIVDCVTIVRELALLKNPVGVFFETENIFTLNDTSEMALNFTATMAQEESHVKSSIMNASIEMRFSHGIVLTPVLLGYDHDENGNLVINEEEALTVRLIFFMYLYGHSFKQIADKLNELQCKTKKGNCRWYESTVVGILRNERYCGDVLTRKTFTPNYLDHKSRKNMGDRTQHRWRNHHEPIIAREDFIAVQHYLDNVKSGGKGAVPQLKVIKQGVFKGFVGINTHWIVFGKEDYETASGKVYQENPNKGNKEDKLQVQANSGDFDLRGFEIARSQLFEIKNRLCVTFSVSHLIFSVSCIKKLNKASEVEMYIHPFNKLLFVRPLTPGNKNSLRWMKISSKGTVVPRNINGTAFLKTVYQILGWNQGCKYRIQGVRKQQGDQTVILFDLNEPELLVPKSKVSPSSDVSDADIRPYVSEKCSVVAFPAEWNDEFGSDVYVHKEHPNEELDRKRWQSGKEDTYSAFPMDNVTSTDTAAAHIKQIINTMQEVTDNGQSDNKTV